jgi:hypothetical protein
MHIAFTLLTAQVLGSIATIVARGVAPDNVGPGDVFPDFSFFRFGDPLDVFAKAWCYLGLCSQIVICVGYFLFFRKVTVCQLNLISRNNLRNRELRSSVYACYFIRSSPEYIVRINTHSCGYSLHWTFVRV